MKKNYTGTLYSDLMSKLMKLSSRLQKKIASGAFWKLTAQKRQAMLARIEKFRMRLKAMNPKFAGAMVAAGFMLTSVGASAQANFVQQTGTNNPADLVVLLNSGYGVPTFADLDNDGDKDMIVGDYYDEIQYFKNTGTSTAAVFTAQTGTNNPFSTSSGFNLNGNGYTIPTFGDIDNDGDFDLLTGHNGDVLQFYRNTGTSTAPVFTFETGTTFPSINTVTGNYYDEIAPSFVDIDADGDLDVLIGDEDIRNIVVLQNTGTASSPVYNFLSATHTSNPFAGVNPVNASYRVEPGFGDIDLDGDIDAWIGGESTPKFFENTGTVTAGNFVLSATNPFSTFTPNGYSYASFVDIDGDTDNDYFVGSGAGIAFYLNTETSLTVDNNDLSQAINVFPNPAENNLTISIENNQMPNAQITLFDVNGAEVMNFKAMSNNTTMNIADLSAGIYTLKITSANNVAVKKIIKK